MARIRTIKPEFWSDGALIECSLNARLLFIGTWNFADDYGNLDRSAKQIKARIFPADSIECEPLIRELIAHGLLSEYSVNGVIYLHIHGFVKHQIVNRPGKPVCPEFDDSLVIHRELTECSVIALAGREGKGREGIKEEQLGASGSARSDPIPYKAIVDLFNSLMTSLAKVRELNADRRTAIRRRWEANPTRRTINFWKQYFEECADDPFLNGTGPYANGHEKWRPDFEYLTREKTMVKVYEKAMDRLERAQA